MTKIIKYISALIIIGALSVPILAGSHSDSIDLHKNSVAILENFSARFTQTDVRKATYTVTKVLKVLEEKGDIYAHFQSYGDQFTELASFSGIIKDSSGKILKKIKKSDLKISSISQGYTMASDSYSIYYECHAPSYPYTVEYTYEQKWKDGIIHYPPFYPADGYFQSIGKAEYRVELPLGEKLRYKSNFDCKIEEKIQAGMQVYIFSMENLAAVKHEPSSPEFKDIFPNVLLAPDDFCYDGQCGSMTTWKDYGLWLTKLLDGRDKLPVALVSELQAMVANTVDDREKVKIIYEYLQKKTRYVSVQLGIGGFQPIPADEVYKNGFGDCKGLSNLMKAMLTAVGIESNYCEIYSGNRKGLFNDFSNISQTNHVILLVPNKGDSIWLECTNQTLPFGYVHENIAGHDALVINENGGEIRKLPTYENPNRSIARLTMHIADDGAIKGNMFFSEHMDSYLRNKSSIMMGDRRQQISYINGNTKLAKIKVSENITTKEDKSEFPWCSLETEFETSEFVNISGSRMFIPICPLNKGGFDFFTASKRELDISISRGYTAQDTVIFNIPEGYKIESLPSKVVNETKYGLLDTSATLVDSTTIMYTQNIDLYEGRYDKSEYEEIKKYLASITAALKRRIVLKKE